MEVLEVEVAVREVEWQVEERKVVKRGPGLEDSLGVLH